MQFDLDSHSSFPGQEENKIMDKMHRQKTAEIEKLSSTVAELEEAVLAGGAAVNAARDYQRQAQELLVRLMVCSMGSQSNDCF